jgi:branched-chain amino acid transport system substrate-binding protein
MMNLTRRHLLGTTAAGLAAATRSAAAEPPDVKIALLVPLSGAWARLGVTMREGAELGVADVNAAGGVKALGGAKLKLMIFDAGDSAEKAKEAAQRMVADQPDLVAASGAYLSTFTLAATEVTERAELPMLTLSYSDLITNRGFRYVFQTSSRGDDQANESIPALIKLAEETSGKRPQTVGIITDNTGASISFVKPLRESNGDKFGLKIVVNETFTPPLSDATQLIQKVRATRPDFLFMPVTVISDAKQLIEKMNEFGIGRGRVPTIAAGIAVADSDMLKNMNPTLLDGLMTVVANWDAKGEDEIQAKFKAATGEPWMTQNGISTYGDMWIIKAALEKAGKADRHAVADALRTIDITDGPAMFYPGHRIKFDSKGLRENAGLVIVQWQKGTPITVYPPELAVAPPIWPKH